MTRTGILLGVIILIIVFLRFVPVGSVSPRQPENPNVPRNIEITKPHYWVPREIEVTGLPFPGGGLTLQRDPHFDYGRVTVFELNEEGGQVIEGRIQVFGINPGFNNPKYVEEFVAVEIGGRILEIDLNPFDTTYPSASGYFFVASKDGAAYFLFSLSGWRIALLEVTYSAEKLSQRSAVFRPGDAVSDQLFTHIDAIVKSGNGQSPCLSFDRVVREFYEKNFGAYCE